MEDPHDHRRLGDAIRDEARRLGFEAVGVAPLRSSDHGAFYRDWIAGGRSGEMQYLARPDAVEARLEPGMRFPWARSAVVVAHHYATSTPNEGDETGPDRGIIARYARGRDYHRVVRKKLITLLRFIEEALGRPLPEARAYVDTGPVLERELARRAGIGWFGRNTMLIDPSRGSYFFLGSLLLPIELDYDTPFDADRCGTCNACVDACPTGALLGRDENGAPVMDARLCISYLTIENRRAIPEALRPAVGNRVYGCDICQEVCPWNSPKLVQVAAEEAYRARAGSTSTSTSTSNDPVGAGLSRAASLPGTEAPSLVELMRMRYEEWDEWTLGSAIRRAGYAGFRRNVAVAMGNWLASLDERPAEAVAVLRNALEDPEPVVREHAAWALDRSVG